MLSAYKALNPGERVECTHYGIAGAPSRDSFSMRTLWWSNFILIDSN